MATTTCSAACTAAIAATGSAAGIDGDAGAELGGVPVCHTRAPPAITSRRGRPATAARRTTRVDPELRQTRPEGSAAPIDEGADSRSSSTSETPEPNRCRPYGSKQLSAFAGQRIALEPDERGLGVQRHAE